MWPNSQETADLSDLLKHSLMENFIFCAVTVDPSYNKLWRGHRILFDIVKVRNWVEKIRKLRFFNCVYFSYIKFAFQSIPVGCRFKIFISVFLFVVATLRLSNKWSDIKHLASTQISVHGNFKF